MKLSVNARWAAPVVVAAALLVGSLPYAIDDARAQAASTNKSAQQYIQDGLKAQKARNHVAAVTLFSRAINGGGLARKQLAYALYYRARSNRVRKQPAEAISDLNSALFFKGDLSSRDRANAIEERAKAFRDAGLQPTAIAAAASPVAPAPQKGGAGWGVTTRSSRPATPPTQRRVVTSSPRRVLEPIKVHKPRRVAAALPAGSPILAPDSDRSEREVAKAPALSAFQTRVAARPVAPRSEPAPVAVRQPNIVPSVERGVGVLPQKLERKQQPKAPWHVSSTKAPPRAPPAWPAAVQRQAALTTPVEPAAVVTSPKETAGVAPESSIGQTTGGIGRFFSNFLSGGNAANSTATTPATTTAAVPPRRTSPAVRADTSRVEAEIGKPRSVFDSFSMASLIPSAGSSGQFEIEVSGFPSQDRADAVAKQLVARRSSTARKMPEPKAVVSRSAGSGETGTLYFVRFGGLANLSESLALCDQLKADGLTCKVAPLY